MKYELSSLHRKGYYAERCCKWVSHPRGWGGRQCERKRGYGPEQAYCKQHDPVAEKARNDERDARWAAEREEIRANLKLQRNAQNFLDALRLIANGHNDPRSLALEAITHYGEQVND
jgi:hypothetical protein